MANHRWKWKPKWGKKYNRYNKYVSEACHVAWLCERCGHEVTALWEPTPLTLRANVERWGVLVDCDEQRIRDLLEE